MSLVPSLEERDWRYEVANGDTQLGFVDWLAHQRGAVLVEQPQEEGGMSDFVAIQRNGAGTDLVPMSARARSYLAARKATGFSRRGLVTMLEAGWTIQVREEPRISNEYEGDISTCQNCGQYHDGITNKACPSCGGHLG